jgi:predicted nuclease of predicted toxin-antitoxin system
LATKVKFYLDEHSPRSLQKALLEYGYEAIMAVDVDMVGKDDDTEHLPYATAQGLVVYTRDHPFAGRTAKRSDHAGLICWTGNQQDIGGMIRTVKAFAEHHSAEEVVGQVFWLK